jgi:hypothetical protein
MRSWGPPQKYSGRNSRPRQFARCSPAESSRRRGNKLALPWRRAGVAGRYEPLSLVLIGSRNSRLSTKTDEVWRQEYGDEESRGSCGGTEVI